MTMLASIIKKISVLSVFIVLFVLISLSLVNLVHAQAKSAEFTVNGLVLNPDTNTFVDSISDSEHKFVPGEEVTFKITVTNGSDHNYRAVLTKFIFSSYLQYTSGDGRYDVGAHTFHLTTTSLNSEETKSYTIKAIVRSDLTKYGTACATNTTSAVNTDTMVSIDYTSLCVENINKNNIKEVKGTTTQSNDISPTVYNSESLTQTPSTGPNILVLLEFTAVGLVGFAIRKYSSKLIH